MPIDGHTRLAAVMANPIKHSLSPFIHNLAFEKTGVNGVYVAWEIAPEDIEESLANIRRYNMFGLNVSLPYKQAVIPFLDKLTPVAEFIGAVNTIVLDNGQLIGHNTDGQGFIRSLEEMADFSIADKKVVMIGSGGTATAIMAQAAFSGVAELIVFTKDAYLGSTQLFLDKLSRQTGVKTELYPITESSILKAKLSHVDLVVNGTRQGMDGKSCPIPLDWSLPKDLLVADVIYQPLETPFLALARRQGLNAINGLGMLLYQAAEAFSLWTGYDMPTRVIWQALEEKLKLEERGCL